MRDSALVLAHNRLQCVFIVEYLGMGTILMEAGIRYAEERDKASGKAETAAGHEDKGDFTDSNLQGE